MTSPVPDALVNSPAGGADQAAAEMSAPVHPVKPKLRGWLHLATAPLALAAGIVLVVAQFVAYLWGGYTAGRMARGAGALNGFLVPLIAIVVAIVVGAVVAALGATANLNLPFTENRLPLENDYLVNWGIGVAVASFIAKGIRQTSNPLV